jgi:hypothetical protein
VIRRGRAGLFARRLAALACAAWLASCASLLSLNEDDYTDIAKDTCELVEKTCAGKFELSLVWGTKRTCQDVVTEATSDGGTVSADELRACFDYATCVEVLDCLADYNVFQLTGADTCRPVGDPCLETCFPDNCLSPHRCCDTICQDGVCQ